MSIRVSSFLWSAGFKSFLLLKAHKTETRLGALNTPQQREKTGFNLKIHPKNGSGLNHEHSEPPDGILLHESLMGNLL